MHITVTKNSDGKFEVQPDDEALKMALVAINCWNSLDDLVTKALRRAGYGGDIFGISYPNDLDEKELVDSGIRDGQVLTFDFDYNDLILEEENYLSMLHQVCLLKGMGERAELLDRFLADPQIAIGLLEADAKACNERWKRFVPFLEKNGWSRNDDMIVAPDYGMSYNAIHFDGDLDVLLRRTEKAIKRLSKKKQLDPNCVRAHRLLLNSLQEFFEFERANSNR